MWRGKRVRVRVAGILAFGSTVADVTIARVCTYQDIKIYVNQLSLLIGSLQVVTSDQYSGQGAVRVHSNTTLHSRLQRQGRTKLKAKQDSTFVRGTGFLQTMTHKRKDFCEADRQTIQNTGRGKWTDPYMI